MQKYYFNKNLSKIYDFYSFVGCSRTEEFYSSDLNKKLNEIGYHLVIEDFYSKHAGLDKKLKTFIYGNVVPFYIFRLMDYDEFAICNTIDEVRDKLLAMSDDKLRERIVSILVHDEETAEYIANPIKMFELIEKVSDDDEVRGRFTRVLAQPGEVLREYLNLLYTVKEDFEAIYDAEKDLLMERGKFYEEELNREGLEAMRRYIRGMFEVPFADLDSYDRIDFALSLFAPAGFSYSPGTSMLIFGIYFDLAFGLKKEIRQEARAALLKNLGEPTRLKVLQAIGAGINTNKELAAHCQLTKATISYHISQLANATMIAVEDNSKLSVAKSFIIRELEELIAEIKDM